jgi:hypothetical protein
MVDFSCTVGISPLGFGVCLCFSVAVSIKTSVEITKSEHSSCDYSEFIINLWKVMCSLFMKEKMVMLAKQINDLGTCVPYVPFLKASGVGTVQYCISPKYEQ